MDSQRKGTSTPLEELAVEVWTRQGRGPLHYIEGETMKVFARVNQPAYIRLLVISLPMENARCFMTTITLTHPRLTVMSK